MQRFLSSLYAKGDSGDQTIAAIRRRHETARGCPKANHTGTSWRQNENFFMRAGSPTYPSPGSVQASPLLGAGYISHLYLLLLSNLAYFAFVIALFLASQLSMLVTSI